MSDFTYTDHPFITSSAVDGLWYSRNTNELAVSLHGDVYVYSGVPESRYNALVNSPSVGRAFREVKRDYGPSEYLGEVDDLDFEREATPAPSMESVGTPKNLTYASNAKVDGKPLAGPVENHLSLTPVANASRRMTVVFRANGTLGQHSLSAENVDEAADTMAELGEALGVDVVVKEVTVHFE